MSMNLIFLILWPRCCVFFLTLHQTLTTTHSGQDTARFLLMQTAGKRITQDGSCWVVVRKLDGVRALGFIPHSVTEGPWPSHLAV